MRIRPCVDDAFNRRLQRKMARKGIVLGLRRSWREGGPTLLWVACLSRTRSIAEASELFRRLYN